MSATSAAELLVGREQAEVGVQPRGLGVVVAGADVQVVADAVALAAHHEHALGVRLQRRVAVDDVDAGLLQLARPLDVGALVEARLELHEADGLLAPLGRADQRGDQRRVVGGPVDRELDRQHVGVVGGLLDEAPDGGRERVVGVVDEDVALRASRRRCRPGAGSSGRRRGWVTERPRRVAQLVEARAAPTICHRSVEVEQARGPRRPGARSTSSASVSASRRSGDMPAPSSTRTTSPKRRRRSSSSTAASRSSASSQISKSASRDSPAAASK